MPLSAGVFRREVDENRRGTGGLDDIGDLDYSATARKI